MPFFEASDGVRLYYEQWGTGDVCVVVDPGWLGSVELYSSIFRPLVRHRLSMLVYERRGQGRSDRPDPSQGDYSVERLARDSVELGDHAGVSKRIGLGMFDGARAAVRHAVECPDRTVGLIMVAPSVSVPADQATYAAFREMLNSTDFPTVLRQLLVMSSPGWTEAERADFVELLRDSTTNEIGNSVWDSMAAVDDRPLLERVRCPALVFGGKQQIVPTPERIHEVVELLPDAHLIELEGSATMPRPGVEELWTSILEFVHDHGIL